jgi:hypothetical protein
MPIGRSGPHGATGIGFLAQQKYYNIFSVDSGPFIFRAPLKGLPEQPYPANAFQSWTYSYNLNLIGQDRFPTGEQFWERPPLGPVPAENLKTWTWRQVGMLGKDQIPVGEIITDLPPRDYQRLQDLRAWLQASTALQLTPPPVLNFVFRPYWRGLPDQPPTPLSQQSAFQSWPVLYTAALPTLPVPLAKQVTDLPQQPYRIEQTWTFTYNKNLIGQDAMLVGEQVFALAPSQVQPDQIQLRAWSWSYNLSLIGKDRLPAGEQIWELAPGQKPSEQVQLHSWTFSYNLNLRGKDQLPIGETVSDLPPRDPREVRAWSWSYNLNLIGQDKLPIGAELYDRPQLPIPPALTWIQTVAYEEVAKPFAQYDWPNPTAPYRIEQTWSWQYNLNLIGQDKFPAGEQTTELPPRDFARILQTWIQQTNLALLTQPPVLNVTIAKYFDRPTLPIPPAQSWEWSYNKNLIGQDQLPIRQSDWPNPIPPATLRDWIAQTNLALLTQPPALLPYKRTLYELPPAGPQQAAPSWTWQYNLNLIGQDAMIKSAQVTDLAPIYPPYINQLRTWVWWYSLELIGQDELPFRQTDWPLTPAAQRAVDLGTWIDRTKFLLAQLYKPFAQYDWPNPTAPFRDPTLATVARGYNLDLLGQDSLPNRQQDWPNPTPFPDYTVLRGFALPFNPALNSGDLTKITRQQQWPLAPGPLQPDRSFSVPFNPNLPPTPPVVTPSVLNKPMLAGPGYLNVIPGEKPS